MQVLVNGKIIID